MNRHAVMIGHPVSSVGPLGHDDAAVTIVQLNADYAGRGTGDPAAVIGRARTGAPTHRVRPAPRPEPPAPTR